MKKLAINIHMESSYCLCLIMNKFCSLLPTMNATILDFYLQSKIRSISKSSLQDSD